MGTLPPAVSVKANTGHTGQSVPPWGFSVTHQNIDVWGNRSSVTAKVQSSPLHRPGSPQYHSGGYTGSTSGSLCGGDGDFSSWILLGHAADNLGCLQGAEARGGYSGCPVGVGVLVSSAKE